jgi:hypothetical protein
MLYNEHGYLWRYMNIEKFTDLVVTQELYFASVKTLRNMTLNGDEAEGTFPEKWIEESIFGPLYSGKEEGKSIRDRITDIVGNYLVNCWNEDNEEALEMWDSFVPSHEGAAIRVKKGKLRRALHDADSSINLFDIRYVNSEEEIPHFGNSLIHWVIHKEKVKFGHEKEVRAIDYNNNPFDIKPFRRVILDLNTLVDLVVVGPRASDGLQDKIECLLQRNSINSIVRPSGFRLHL